MGFTRVRTVRFAFVAALGAVLLSGCTPPAPAPSPSSSASRSPTASASPASPSPSPSTSTSVAPADGICSAGQLAASIQGAEGAAGSNVVTVALTNTSETECTLQGWPGVSLVGDGNGTQIGAAAAQDDTSPHETVTLAAGGGVGTFAVTIADALNYSDADCGPKDADGLRIYAPGDRGAVFVPGGDTPFVGCTVETVSLLTTGAIQPG